MGVYNLKQEAKYLHNSSYSSYIRKGSTAFAVFLLSLFAEHCKKSICGSGCRSPPTNLNFHQKIQIGGTNMKGNHPKRRKDKYNPYQIWELDGHYYIAFENGQGVPHEFEISKTLYDAFNEFELRDISYLHKWDKYIEHSEVWESTLNRRALQQPDSVEEIVFKNMLIEKLHKGISNLSEIQKRRVRLYFFEGLTYEQIAIREGCTKMPVKRSIDAAIEKLKKEMKK